ncbi:MAG: hypothetical protein JNM22_14690 [Saprospiraceae bacterium]|nr:hypothetical protein [Saprospiraceae bacterium]
MPAADSQKAVGECSAPQEFFYERGWKQAPDFSDACDPLFRSPMPPSTL